MSNITPVLERYIIVISARIAICILVKMTPVLE
uniref:Uncharacterized protein n=1 Tax=Arundo donax TaxID=35708 RepID=A0A0A9C8H6_ARUDO